MRNVRKKTMPKRRKVVKKKVSKAPQPPTCPQGFVYTALSGDTVSSIAEQFNMPLKEIAAANPQISDFSRIKPGWRICLPFTPAPITGSIEFFGPDGKALRKKDGATQLAQRTTIRVALANATHLFYMFAPAGTESVSRTKLLGAISVSTNKRSAEFVWKVPSHIKGGLFVIACNRKSCRVSDRTGVASGRW